MARRRVPVRAAAGAVKQVRELAWVGRHAEAIEVASTALDRPGLGAADRVDLLDLRCESHLALGDTDRARADANEVIEVADRSGVMALRAQARNRASIVQIRVAELKPAIATAETALRLAREAGNRVLEATSQLRIAEACMRLRDNPRSIAAARESARLFRSLRLPAGENRALWALGAALSNLGETDEAARVCREALALARSCGDWFGVGNAANMLTFDEGDFAVRFRLLKESLAAFERAGYVERQAIITHNLGISYYHLGLYRRARRYFLSARATYLQVGGRGGIARTTWMLALTESELGQREAARRYMQASIDEIAAVGGEGYVAGRPLGEGWLAFVDGDMHAAVRLRRDAVVEARAAAQDGVELLAATRLVESLLAASDARGALDASREGVAVHAKHGFATLQGMDRVSLWWQHHRALAANGRRAEARSALDRAYGFVVKGIATLSDEGLRRNSVNKVGEVRAIVAGWLAAHPNKRPPHLAGTASLVEPFERLADTGLRLNEIRSRAELLEFLIDEATELSGAERMLLVLEASGGRSIAGSQMPKGEDASALLDAIAPLLDDVQRSRAARLDHVPERAEPLSQRSRIVAPLVAQQSLIGYLYADIDGRFGRFHESDRDLLAMLAAQGAVALANAQASEALEAKVAERTEELRASKAVIEARAAELAIVNSVQQALAGELSMQGVYDAVGEKLREVFGGAIVTIRIYDPATGLEHYPYVRHGDRRYEVASQALGEAGFGAHVLRTRRTLVIDEDLPSRVAEYGSSLLATGMRLPKTQVMVPLLVGGQVRGILQLNDEEREHAFSPSDVRLLETLASSMSVALENARLFDETQRLLKETEERNAELAVINSVQQGIAGSLNFRDIVDLVGDKLREVLGNGDVSIRWLDVPGDRMLNLYSYERGRRLPEKSSPLSEVSAASKRLFTTGKANVFNSIAEQLAENVGVRPGTERAKSMAYVPIKGRGGVVGAVGLENHEREHAFGEAEVRLLTTIASAMGVALENARLFEETQRLLKETEQRNAELAVINSIQQGIASKLDFQAIVDLVGDKLREVFASGDVAIRWIDYATELVRLLYVYEHGVRLQPPPPARLSADKPLARRLLARETVVINDGGIL